MAELFNIRLESDLSEFDSTVTDGGDLSQGTPGLAGTAGRMECLIDDTTVIYGRKDFTISTTQLRYRFYIDPNALSMATSDSFRVATINLSASPFILTNVNLVRSASSYRIQAVVNNDGGTGRTLSIVDISDAEHFIEVLVVKASSDSANDGELHLWIDGSFQSSRADIDTYDAWSLVTDARLGARDIDAGTSGTFYLDEFVANDDGGLIGPYVSLVTVLTTYDGYSVPIGA